MGALTFPLNLRLESCNFPESITTDRSLTEHGPQLRERERESDG
jgi:hypothetical protein